MDIWFWLGLALAIPLSILANIYTPRVQSYLDERRERISSKRFEKVKKEFEEIKYYFENKSELRNEMLAVMIRTTYILSLVGIISGLANIPSFQIDYDKQLLYTLFAVLPLFISIIGALVIVKICSDAMKLYSKVKGFKKLEVEYVELEKKYKLESLRLPD